MIWTDEALFLVSVSGSKSNGSPMPLNKFLFSLHNRRSTNYHILYVVGREKFLNAHSKLCCGTRVLGCLRIPVTVYISYDKD